MKAHFKEFPKLINEYKDVVITSLYQVLLAVQNTDKSQFQAEELSNLVNDFSDLVTKVKEGTPLEVAENQRIVLALSYVTLGMNRQVEALQESIPMMEEIQKKFIEAHMKDEEVPVPEDITKLNEGYATAMNELQEKIKTEKIDLI